MSSEGDRELTFDRITAAKSIGGGPAQIITLSSEELDIDELKPHPRNYRAHPEDELAHLVRSIQSHGLYRNIVIARDGTILAGHAVVAAARRLGLARVPVVRVPYDPYEPRALKLLVADNEIRHLADVDDRALTELLREIRESGGGLLGTGFDDMMLANLAFVSRPASEIADLNAAAQWVGMPEYVAGTDDLHVTVHFASEADRQEFGKRLGIDMTNVGPTGGRKGSIWWPERKQDDLRSIAFADGAHNG